MANIEYRKGNLLDVTSGVIAHGVNCQGVMGSGVALAIKVKYPEVFERYKNLCKENDRYDSPTSHLLGEVQTIELPSYGLTKFKVANCFTQDSFGTYKRQVNYEAVAKCFQTLDQMFLKVNIPKIGAGLGGGDWNVIEAIINSEFEGDVIVWEL